MGLEHERIVPPHICSWRADGYGPRDVGRAVGVLTTGVDEVERARAKLQIASDGGAVMDDGTVRAGSRDAVEADVLEFSGLAPELFECRRRADLVDPA